MEKTQGMAAPPAAGAPPGLMRRRVVLAVMCVALMMIVSMVVGLTVALPGIAADTGASQSQLLWIMNSYGLVFAGFLLPAGALGDRYGRKGMLMAGVVVFGVASALPMWVDDPGILILLRVVAGLGSAMIMPMTLSIVTTVFPPEERAGAVAVWSAVAAGGALMGLLISGALLEAFSWRSIFGLSVALAILSAVLVMAFVPTSKDPDELPVDVVGAVLSVAGLCAVVYAIIEGPERGWSDTAVLLAAVGGVAALVGFVLWELRVEHPLLDPRFFRIRAFASGSIVIVMASVATFGLFFVILQYLQWLKGYSPLVAGLSLMPMTVAVGAVSPLAPVLVRRAGLRVVLTAGMIVMAVGMGVLTTLDKDSSYLPVLVGTTVVGAGIALCLAPATDSIVASLPAAKQGVASAVNDVTREVGGALGIAILGSASNSGYRAGVGDRSDVIPGNVLEAVRGSVDAALATAERLGGATGARVADAARTAFADGMDRAMLVAALIVAVGAAAVLWLAPGRAESIRLQEKQSEG
ncbi:DHA2 family efflux MFS transporter permease subunit [Streptomyces longwoodensis]|uniref:DHA2 family efflux MFS transporter permease subunit n=1 Tax=Streptomyces longwoodensis TaxID=68231 RepID=UPI0034007C40